MWLIVSSFFWISVLCYLWALYNLLCKSSIWTSFSFISFYLRYISFCSLAILSSKFYVKALIDRNSSSCSVCIWLLILMTFAFSLLRAISVDNCYLKHLIYCELFSLSIAISRMKSFMIDDISGLSCLTKEFPIFYDFNISMIWLRDYMVLL